MTDVAIRHCKTYEPEQVRQALLDVLEPLGGLSWVKKDMRIGIKTNLVSAMKPETAATTHPVMLAELTRLLRERGAEVIVGDSPGGLFNAAYLERVYAVTGLRAVEEAGGTLNRDFSQKTAVFEKGTELHSFSYTGWLDSCDAIIDFCKLKTHGMMGLSAAAKNMFGTIPGTLKPEYHYRFPTPERFSHMIVDLDEYFKMRLCICDAVVGMEGNGPTQGNPRPIGALLAAENPHKLDVLAAELIGLEPVSVPTIAAAVKRGLTPGKSAELSIDGAWEDLICKDYVRIEHYDSTLFGMSVPGFPGKLLSAIASAGLRTRPAVAAKECIGCGKCAGICPAKAIKLVKKKPVIDRKKCIGCFCCQEFCPCGAMKAHRPLPARILGK